MAPPHVLQTIGDHPQRQRLSRGESFFPCSTVDRDAGKRRNVRDPPAVIFARELDLQVKRSGFGGVFRHFKFSVTKLR